MVPSLRADGFSDKALLYLFSHLPSGNVDVAGQTCAFSLRPGATLQTAKELARFCYSLFNYRDQIPFKTDNRKLIFRVIFDA